jgi:protocatechuate 3,4-dioxygenase beta subunit
MTLLMMLVSLLLQAPPARPPAAKASISGAVIHGGTGMPMANVTVTLARTDPSLGAFAEMVAGDHPPFEITLTGDLLSFITEQMTQELAAGNGDPSPRQTAEVSAVQSLPLDDLETITVTPTGDISVTSKSSPPVTTDSQGRFSFDNLAPGKYRLTFTAPGYARQNYGQRGSAGTATPILLEAGQSRRDILMRMTPVAAISGRLTDRSGRPIAGVPVEVIRFEYDATGKSKRQRVASVQTDDRGAYRIYYLTPGRYYLSAGHQSGGATPATGIPPELAALTNMTAPQLTTNRVPQNYAISYYPGVAEIKAGAILDIQPGAEVKDIDLTLDLQQPYRVRGVVLDPSGGQPPQNAGVTIQPRDVEVDVTTILSRVSRDFRSTYNPADGSFELRATPGAYTLRADVSGPQGSLRGSANINVGNGDVEGVILIVGSAGSVSGTVRFESGVRTPERNFTFAKVQLKPQDSPAEPFEDSLTSGPKEADGSFRIANVWPGEYHIALIGLPSGYYLKSARLGEFDTLNGPLRVASGDFGPLDITIGVSAGQVDGLAVDAQGQPMPGALVALIPERGRERTELFRSATADAGGRFSFPAVVPGDYKLASWENVDPYAFFDPELIRQADEHGKPVRVTETSKQTLNATPITAGP